VEYIVRLSAEQVKDLHVGAKFQLVRRVSQRSLDGDDYHVLLELKELSPEPPCRCCRDHEPTAC